MNQGHGHGQGAAGDGDEAVQATNDDATVCKRSATHLGYWCDPYLNYFTKGPIVRKAPEINRGYFARTFGMYHLIVDTFDKIYKSQLREGQATPERRNSRPSTPSELGGGGESSTVAASTSVTNVQIVNLGCGSDTLYWRLKREEKLLERKRHLHISTYVDVDFPSTTMKKINAIKTTSELLSQLSNDDGEISMSNYDLHSYNYHIIGTDLRDINQVSSKLGSCNLNNDDLTIFIAECVLVYMEPKMSQVLLKWIAENFKTSLFINYEQVNMIDKFAEVMLSNLVQRGCLLSGVEHCKDLITQQKRFTDAGWTQVKGWTMNEVYASIPKKELERIETIELLDEQELLQQLFDHYCIILAVNLKGSTSFNLENVGFE